MKLKIVYTAIALSAKGLNSLPSTPSTVSTLSTESRWNGSPTLFVEGVLDIIDSSSELPSSLDDLSPSKFADYLDERADADSQANWPLYFTQLGLPAGTKLQHFTNWIRSADPDFLNMAAAAEDQDDLLRDAFEDYMDEASTLSTSGTSQLTFGSLVALGLIGWHM